MNRRDTLLGLIVLGAVSLAAEAQQAGQITRIGFLWGGSLNQPLLHVFEDALREHGWTVGRNIVIEHRAAEGRNERLSDLAGELVHARVSVILTSQAPSTVAAKKASSTIPIVMLGNGDPVRYGLVANLARPEANVTGLSFLQNEVAIKAIQLLKEMAPKTEHLALFGNPTNQGFTSYIDDLGQAAPQLGIKIHPVAVRNVSELDDAIPMLRRNQIEAVFLPPEAFVFSQRRRIVDFAMTNRWPVIGGNPGYTDVGALMSYSAHIPTIYRRAADYVDKLLRGAKPGDLPIEQPTTFELVINLKTAKALGITIPSSVLLRADRVIE